ncbi:unnamed protein product, partial [Dibothriocephalus latus]
SCDLSSEDEVTDEVRRLRNCKACLEENIPTEIYKYFFNTLAFRLRELIVQACRVEAVPDDWGSGIIVSVHKKGDKTKCENYRGISLIGAAAKIFGIVLLRCFRSVRDSESAP